MNQFEIEQHPDFDQHETVIVRQDEDLTAIIAVHNSNLGPAVGGARMFPYTSSHDALTDVLRLSRGMTYKSALAGLPLGGGKSVIIADPARDKSTRLFHAMGEFVDSLGGAYITAEDSGTSVADIARIGERTRFVSGVLEGDRHGGDPSPMTAYGVLVGISEAVRYRCNTDLKGIRVAIQGVGNVGWHLARMLIDEGALVTAADVSERNIERLKSLNGVRVVSPEEILQAEVDVLAPCALGGVLSDDVVRGIRAGIVAGAANNQLLTPGVGHLLQDRGILYAPDYVINAGGIIDVYYQRCDVRDSDIVSAHIQSISESLKEIFVLADERRQSTQHIANEMAEARLLAAASARSAA